MPTQAPMGFDTRIKATDQRVGLKFDGEIRRAFYTTSDSVIRLVEVAKVERATMYDEVLASKMATLEKAFDAVNDHLIANYQWED